jgi:hypothetical protein
MAATYAAELKLNTALTAIAKSVCEAFYGHSSPTTTQLRLPWQQLITRYATETVRSDIRH